MRLLLALAILAASVAPSVAATVWHDRQAFEVAYPVVTRDDYPATVYASGAWLPDQVSAVTGLVAYSVGSAACPPYIYIEGERLGASPGCPLVVTPAGGDALALSIVTPAGAGWVARIVDPAGAHVSTVTIPTTGGATWLGVSGAHAVEFEPIFSLAPPAETLRVEWVEVRDDLCRCDVDGDSASTAADALLIAQMATGSAQADPCADIDGDGSVTILDALAMAQVASGLPCPQ